MKNIWIIIVILLLIGVGVFAFTRNNSEAPTTEDNMDNMGDMTSTPTPTGYNTPVNTNSNAPVKEFTIEGKNFSFAPNSIRVKKGDQVKITFKNTQGFHDLVVDEFRAATKQIRTGEQETITFIADKTGSFEYYCSVGTHRAMGMTGTLIVE